MQVIEKAGFQVTGIQVTADWQGLHKEMPAAWQIFKERVAEINHRLTDNMLDICMGCKDGKYTQVICVEVDAADGVPEGMSAHYIPAQRYIHYRHEGPLQAIAESFGRMYQWAEEHGYQTDEFKLDYGYTQDGKEQGHDLYIRVI